MTTLVLLPGLDGTGELFVDFVDALGSDVEVIVVSYPRDQALGYRELEDVARALLPIDRPYVLLAESFSGPIGIAIAASSPPGLLALVLCCTFAKLPFPFGKWMQHLAGMAPVSLIPQSSLDLVLLGRHMTRDLRERFAVTLNSVAPEVLRRRAQDALGVDRTEQLANIRVPVLCLCASEDPLISRNATQRMASLIPASEVVVFDAPHFLLQVRSRDVAAAVTAFADSLRN